MFKNSRPPRELPTLFLIVLTSVALTAFVPSFRSRDNLTVVCENAAFIGIMACGEGLVLLGGGLDLSVGSTLAVASCSGAAALAAGLAWPIAAALAVLAGALCGAINGGLVTWRRLPPILSTLATLL